MELKTRKLKNRYMYLRDEITFFVQHNLDQAMEVLYVCMYGMLL